MRGRFRSEKTFLHDNLYSELVQELEIERRRLTDAENDLKRERARVHDWWGVYYFSFLHTNDMWMPFISLFVRIKNMLHSFSFSYSRSKKVIADLNIMVTDERKTTDTMAKKLWQQSATINTLSLTMRKLVGVLNSLPGEVCRKLLGKWLGEYLIGYSPFFSFLRIFLGSVIIWINSVNYSTLAGSFVLTPQGSKLQKSTVSFQTFPLRYFGVEEGHSLSFSV